MFIRIYISKYVFIEIVSDTAAAFGAAKESLPDENNLLTFATWRDHVTFLVDF